MEKQGCSRPFEWNKNDHRLPQQKKLQTTEENANIFSKIVLEGKVNAAIQLLDDDTSSGVLPLSASDKKTLRQKHPNAKPSNNTIILHGLFNHVNKIIFDGVNADLMRKCVIRTKSSHGPSGLDAKFRSTIYNSTFGNASDNLSHAIAKLLPMLCSEELVDPKRNEKLDMCWLIPLLKKGNTHGDPIAMEMYALGLMPLPNSIISDNTRNLIHIAFADVLIGVGKIYKLNERWKNVFNYSLYPVYYVNESKSWLLIKEEYIEIANKTNKDYTIKKTIDGLRHLGAVIDLIENKEEFVITKVSQ